MTIFVSAGHHAEKQGARHRWFKEYPEALHWQNCLVYHLGTDAAAVPAGYLAKKVAFINDHGTRRDLAVEVHFNAAVDEDGNPVGRGSETLYHPGSEAGRRAAERVQATLATHFRPDRGVKEGYYQMDPSNGPDYFLARIPMPALILEPGFIHHHEELTELREAACRDLAETLRSTHDELRKGAG